MTFLGFRFCTKLSKISSIKTLSNESCRYNLSIKTNGLAIKALVTVKKSLYSNIIMAFPKDTSKTSKSLLAKRGSVGSIFAGCCFSLCKKRKDDVESESQSFPTEHTKLISSLSPQKTQENLEIGVDDLSKSFEASGAFPSLTGSVRVASNIKETIKTSSILSVKADIVPESSSKVSIDEESKSRKRPKSTQETGQEQKKKRKPPNYFVALQIKNPNIIEGLKKVQDHILKGEPKLQPALVSLKKLHITLLVFHAEDDTELQKAKETLEETAPNVKKLIESSVNLDICKVSSFKNQVVFAGIKDDEEKKKLFELTEILTSNFENNGFGVREGRPFNPHLTLFKLSQAPKLAKKGIRKIDNHLFEEHCDTEFGTESIQSIQLLSMNKEKDEKGYYHCVSELHFDTM